LGASAVALGVLGLVTGDFASTWHPVPPELPFRQAAALAAAVLFLAFGFGLQFDRTRRAAGLGLALLFTVFVMLWARRVAAFPTMTGTWLGAAEQAAVAIGAVAASGAWLSRTVFLRIGFGACQLVFGLAHLVLLKETASMTPAWLPPGPTAWAVITGLLHVAGGLALLSGLRAVLAARLLAAMFVGFGALVWAPMLLAKPEDAMTWGGNAINLALIGAVWALADRLAANRSSAPGESARAVPPGIDSAAPADT